MTAASRESAKVRLRKHFATIARRIAEDVDSQLLSGSPEAVANFRENSVRTAIERFLPRSFDTAKGQIYDVEGNQSASIDIVVLGSNHPKFRDSNGQIDIILVDGVHCAIEVKPDISDMPDDFGASRSQQPEIVRALKQITSVKKLTCRSEHLNGRKIPSYIVARRARDLPCLTRYVARFYREQSTPVEERVDAIFVLGVGFLLIPREFPASPPLRFPVTMSAVCGDDTFASLLLRIAKESSSEMYLTAPILPAYIADFDHRGHYLVDDNGAIFDSSIRRFVHADGTVNDFPEE